MTRLIVVLLALIPPAMFAQVSFTSASYTSGDQSTASIANGDFNGDGILDLITVNYRTLSFYKGLGGGKFANPTNQAIPTNLGQAAAADLNGDGKLDLAVTSNQSYQSTGVITILLGNGNGTFSHGTNISTPGSPGSIALADFNGDHIPDIAVSVCTTSSCETIVYLGHGNGTFQESAHLSYGGVIGVGDFNADGHQDIAIADQGGKELVMYLGSGNGSFQSPVLTSVSNIYSLAVGDFYHNHTQSLAVLTFVPNNTFFDNYISSARYSNGQLLTSSPQFIANNFSIFRVAAGDLNGDFKDDVVLTGGTKFGGGSLTYYMLGNGNGTFQSLKNLPGYGQSEPFPFIRDLNLDSRHDIGAGWANEYMVTGGGAFVLLNTNAATNCAPPKANALSVHVCGLSNGQTLSSAHTFMAAGNGFNGIAKRMELWIDGKKIGTDLEDQLKITATLPAGKHVASFIAVDSFDNHVTKSISFNVQ